MQDEDAPTVPCRLLVVDDQRDALMTLALLLEAEGHQVRAVCSGEEAISAAEQFHPQIAFVDISMPDMDGYELARRIRAQSWGESLFLVALTAHARPADKVRASGAGFDAHLAKPCDYDSLKAIIAGLASCDASRHPA